MTVGSYDYIPVGGHDHEVPAVAPELAYRLLRTSLAVEQGGIFLGRIKIGREYFPACHHFAVGCRHFDFADLAEF